MADWDEESPQLRKNLYILLRRIRDDARRRSDLSVESVRAWHIAAMLKLDTPESMAIGRFRGEKGLEAEEVQIGAYLGEFSAKVATALANFDFLLKGLVSELDQSIPGGVNLDEDQIAAVLTACGWAHAEWVRIHPFANGNGRAARLLANALAMRYGLPPFVQLRPRPGGGYAEAGEAAMRGDWEPTVALFRRMLDLALDKMGGSD